MSEAITTQQTKVEDVTQDAADKWKEVKPDGDSNAWNPENPGDSIEGLYVSKEPSKIYPNNFVYKLLVKQDETNSEEKIVFGSTVLNRKLAEVKDNSLIRIVYKGLVKSVNNLTQYKDFDVFVHEA